MDRKRDCHEGRKRPNKLLRAFRVAGAILQCGGLGWVYFMGIICPRFPPPYQAVYRGIGYGFGYLLYFILVPMYIKKNLPDLQYGGVIVSAASFVLTVALLVITFPLQMKT